ncbi:hypothetical protein GJ496_011433 [Pomphorhynchus laevis]|nr:hypothetical protein GJ496_011433 [Pomphorhynchus laevis]
MRPNDDGQKELTQSDEGAVAEARELNISESGSSVSVSRISLNTTKGSDEIIPKSICSQINRDKKCEDFRGDNFCLEISETSYMNKHVTCLEVRSLGLYPIIPASELQNIYATYILNTFPIPRYPRNLTGHNVHSVSIARMLNIKIREMDGCAREYRSKTFMRRALTCLTYMLKRRKSGHSRRKTRERRRRRCPYFRKNRRMLSLQGKAFSAQKQQTKKIRVPRTFEGSSSVICDRTVVRSHRLIRSSRRKNVEQCCNEELQTIKPCYVLLEYYTVIFCEFRESGSPFSETFVPAKSDTSANVNETTNTLDTFTNPYEATDTLDTFTNANEAKDLLDKECEIRVIRFWRNRMIKLGLGIEDDADELLDRKGDTAAVPADESDATRMEDVDYQIKC